MKQKPNYGNRRQQGIALPIIMIILVLAALVTIYTTTTSVKEQQVTADQYRSEQAFATAQAGVDVALERHNHFETPTPDGCGISVPPERDITSNCTDFSASEKGSFKVMFCDIWDDGDETANNDTDGDTITGASLMMAFLTDIDSCSNPINIANADEPDGFKNDERVGILSVGKPDDASGRRTISVVSAPMTLFSDEGPPDVPFTARGSLGLGANITVINRYSNITVWTGDNLSTKSAAISTFIYSGSDQLTRSELINNPKPTPGACKDDNVINATTATCGMLGLNADVLDNDANLTNISPDELFERIFSLPKEEIKALAIDTGKYYTDDQFQGKTGLIWLEVSPGGLPSIDVGILDKANNYQDDAPAFLVIEVDGSGTVQINGGDAFGMIFLFGNVRYTGSTTIGTVIVTGAVENSSGNMMVIHDKPGIAVNPEGLGGLRGIEPGTWKDWGYVN